MNHAGRQTGFTVVELVACIVILGILAVTVVPKLLDNNTLAARTYSYEIATALREAQAVAVASGCEVALSLNARNYAARQRRAAGNHCSAAGGWTVAVLRADGDALAGTAPDDTRLSPATRIVFDARGRVISGTPPVLAIDTYSVRIDPLSGLALLR